MPYFSDDIIEEVRSRNDIVDVIGQYVHLTKKGSTYFGLCHFIMKRQALFLYRRISRCITASAAVREEMYLPSSCSMRTLHSRRRWKRWLTGPV